MDPLPCLPQDLQMPGTEFNPKQSTGGSATTNGKLHSEASMVSFQLDQLDGLGGEPDAKRPKKA